MRGAPFEESKREADRQARTHLVHGNAATTHLGISRFNGSGAVMHGLAAVAQGDGRKTQIAAGSADVARTARRNWSRSGTKNDVRAPGTVGMRVIRR